MAAVRWWCLYTYGMLYLRTLPVILQLYQRLVIIMQPTAAAAHMCSPQNYAAIGGDNNAAYYYTHCLRAMSTGFFLFWSSKLLPFLHSVYS